MKQIVTLGAPGGVGRTAVALALTHWATQQGTAVLVDAEVEGNGLAALLPGEALEGAEAARATEAVIDAGACTACGICAQVCQFSAVEQREPDAYHVVAWACTGCAACLPACPFDAIALRDAPLGRWIHRRTALGSLFVGAIEPGHYHLGEVITQTRWQATRYAVSHCADWVVIDGPSGVGRDALAACAGVDLALVVAEPGPAGQRAAERSLALAARAGVRAAVAINKATLSDGQTGQLVDALTLRDVALLGLLPYDSALAEAAAHGAESLLLQESPFLDAMAHVWQGCRALLRGAEPTDQPDQM